MMFAVLAVNNFIDWELGLGEAGSCADDAVAASAAAAAE